MKKSRAAAIPEFSQLKQLDIYAINDDLAMLHRYQSEENLEQG